MSRPTHVQVARAANFIHTLLQFRRTIDRESLSPVSLATLVLTLCSACVCWEKGISYLFSALSDISCLHRSLFCHRPGIYRPPAEASMVWFTPAFSRYLFIISVPIPVVPGRQISGMSNTAASPYTCSEYTKNCAF